MDAFLDAGPGVQPEHIAYAFDGGVAETAATGFVFTHGNARNSNVPAEFALAQLQLQPLRSNPASHVNLTLHLDFERRTYLIRIVCEVCYPFAT